MMDDYDYIIDKYKDISIISSIRGVLSYDLETHTTPNAGVEHRGVQFQYLSKLIYNIWHEQDFSQKILKLQGQLDGLNYVQKRNIQLLNRTLSIQNAIPLDLVNDLSIQANKTNESWKKAKTKVDFSIVAEDFRKLFELTRKRGEILAEKLDKSDPYSALLGERDAGLTSKALSDIFDQTKSFLVPFIQKQKSKFEDIDSSKYNYKVSRETQVLLTQKIADIYQYDYKSENSVGIIGEVEHPLTIGCGPKDVRVTVKYEGYLRAMNAAAHELGHGLTGLNKNSEWLYQPVNNSGFPSLGEMTSRYTENKIGMSRPYWDYLYPFVQSKVPELKSVDLDEFYRFLVQISPGTSRMSADEVTYGLHIIIRFEIERDLFEGKLDAKDVPQVWNEKYSKYLGVDVPNDTLGLMQDLHWYSYYWAYFQGYALGDLMGSQIHYEMVKQNPNWQDQLRNGDMTNINQFFIKNVYSKGALYDPFDLVKEVTHETFTVDYFKKYLTEKFSNL